MSHYLTVPANRQETHAPVRKVRFESGQFEHLLLVSESAFLVLMFHIPPTLFLSDTQVYSSKHSAASVPSVHVELPSPSSLDTASLEEESANRPNQNQEQDWVKGDTGLRFTVTPANTQGELDQQRLARCLSDPGPNKEEEEDDLFLS